MLKVEGLTRDFGTDDSAVRAVDDVTFTLPQGVFAAVIGRSGSGKSTLLSLLGTLDKPSAGSVEIDGQDVTAMSERDMTAYRRDKIGFVFQSYNLIPNLTAIQNVMLPMEFAGLSAASQRARAVELLDQVGLEGPKQKRVPGRLSGGEQQRVAIARALANRPSLVLADEPTGNLDSETGRMIVDLLRQLALSENTTVLAVTHDTGIADDADVTFRLSDGRLVEAFSSAATRSDAVYEAWRESRDESHLQTLVAAIDDLVTCAPPEKRISATKLRVRYADAVGEPAFDEALGTLDR
jgi:putative ABC transport system ATP-binding protein